jgi:hypothetical protein
LSDGKKKDPPSAQDIVNAAAKKHMPNKAPAFNKGVQQLDIQKFLAESSSHDVRALMGRNFALWAQFSGVKVDGHDFNFETHRYLLPIYMDHGRRVVWMKAAQLGATVYMLLRLLWYARYKQVNAALYFPTGGGVEDLSKARLGPLIASNDELSDNLTDTNTLGLKQIRNVHGTDSSLYMLYMGGKASKDSVPLDILAFDEVRLIDPADIDQVQERIAHSSHKVQIYMSTAGYPDTDIHARFMRGTQLTWHTACNCPDGVVLPDVFPDCVVERKLKDGTTETYYRCPKCKFRINDVQNGNYIAHNPGADFNSYSVTQLNSYYISPKDLFDFYKTTTNIREFYNGKLGRPYVDEDARPITDDVFNSCINDTLKWQANLPSRRIKGGCAMGVDQHSGNCFVTIMRRGKDGKKQLAHIEVIESSNPIYWEYNEKTGEDGPVSPFKRLGELMTEFNVGMCVIDAMPNINEAYQFARDFPGKVFIAHYKDAGQDMVLWYDRTKTKEAIRKGSKETRMKHQVLLNRYTVLDYALKQWTDGIMEVPPVGQFTPLVRNEKTGRFEATSLALTLRDHLKRLVRQETVLNEETGKSKMEWIYLGGDPHFAHAFSYCNVAIERLRTTALFTFG